DRSTLVLFGDGAGAAVLEAVPERGFIGFELGADGAGGANLWLPGSGSRLFDDPDKYVKMNGREVFKFATRILVQSAQDFLERGGAASGLDLERLCFHADASELVDTAVQQPALVATSLAMLAAIRDRGIEPDFVVGHSVGEFAALAAAESISLEDAIALV